MKNIGFQYRRPWLMKVNQGFFVSVSDRSVGSVGLLTRKATRPFEFAGNSVGAHFDLLADDHGDLVTSVDLEYEREVFLLAAEQGCDLVSPHTWQFFWLSHVDGLSIEEVSNRLNLQTANVFRRTEPSHEATQAKRSRIRGDLIDHHPFLKCWRESVDTM